MRNPLEDLFDRIKALSAGGQDIQDKPEEPEQTFDNPIEKVAQIRQQEDTQLIEQQAPGKLDVLGIKTDNEELNSNLNNALEDTGRDYAIQIPKYKGKLEDPQRDSVYSTLAPMDDTGAYKTATEATPTPVLNKVLEISGVAGLKQYFDNLMDGKEPMQGVKEAKMPEEEPKENILKKGVAKLDYKYELPNEKLMKAEGLLNVPFTNKARKLLWKGTEVENSPAYKGMPKGGITADGEGVERNAVYINKPQGTREEKISVISHELTHAYQYDKQRELGKEKYKQYIQGFKKAWESSNDPKIKDIEKKIKDMGYYDSQYNSEEEKEKNINMERQAFYLQFYGKDGIDGVPEGLKPMFKDILGTRVIDKGRKFIDKMFTPEKPKDFKRTEEDWVKAVDEAKPKIKDWIKGGFKAPAYLLDLALEGGANLLFGSTEENIKKGAEKKGLSEEETSKAIEEWQKSNKEMKDKFKPSNKEEAKVLKLADVATTIPTGIVGKVGDVSKLAKLDKAEDVLKTAKKLGVELTEDTAKQIAKETDPKKVGELVNKEQKTNILEDAKKLRDSGKLFIFDKGLMRDAIKNAEKTKDTKDLNKMFKSISEKVARNDKKNAKITEARIKETKRLVDIYLKDKTVDDAVKEIEKAREKLVEIGEKIYNEGNSKGRNAKLSADNDYYTKRIALLRDVVNSTKKKIETPKSINKEQKTTSEISKAKAEGKSFEEFAKAQRKLAMYSKKSAGKEAKKITPVAQYLFNETKGGSEVLTELEISTAGKREGFYDTESAGYNEFVNTSTKSTFPKWIPEELRSKDLFKKVQDKIEKGELPTSTKQKKLYDVLMEEVSKRENTIPPQQQTMEELLSMKVPEAKTDLSQLRKQWDKATQAKEGLSDLSEKTIPYTKENLSSKKGLSVSVKSLAENSEKVKVEDIQKAIKQTRGRTLRENVQDAFSPLERLTKVKGVKVTDKNDPHLANTLFHGRVGARTEALYDEVSKIEKEIKPIRTEVFDYLKALHDPERKAVLGEKSTGMTTEKATELVKNVKPEVKEASKKIQLLNKKTLDVLEKGGLISTELKDKLRKMYPNHIPLNRIQEEEDFVGYLTSKGRSVKSSGLKRAVGSEKAVDDIMVNVTSNLSQAIIQAEKNKYNQAVVQFARDNDGLHGLFTVEKPKAIGKNFDGKMLTAIKNEKNALVALKDGKAVVLRINDDHLAEVVKGLNIESVPYGLRTIAGATRMYASLATRFNLDFPLSNTVRDIQEALVYMGANGGAKSAVKTIGHQPKSYIDVIDGLGKAKTKGGKLYRQMVMDGGTTGGLGLSTRKQIDVGIKKIRKLNKSNPRKAVKAVVDKIDQINTVFEDATRLSAYKDALSRGLSRERASQIAKESTINFNKKGKMTPALNALYMFSNASIQGSTKMLQAMKNPKVALATTASIAVPTIYFNDWNDKIDPDWRDKIAPYEREKNLIILRPSDGDLKYFKIPVGWGIAPIKTLVDVGDDARKGHVDKNGVGKVVKSIVNSYDPIGGQTIAQKVTPSIARPGMDTVLNKKWTGNMLHPDIKQGEAKHDKYWSSLEKTKMGEMSIKGTALLFDKTGVDINPASLNYVLKSYVSGAGKITTRVFNTVEAKGDLPSQDKPFINRFAKEIPADEVHSNKQYSKDDEFYKQIKKLEKGTPEYTKKVSEYLQQFEGEEYKKKKAGLYYKGVSTTGVSSNKGIEQNKDKLTKLLKLKGEDTEAFNKEYNALSDADKKLFKTFKATQSRKSTEKITKGSTEQAAEELGKLDFYDQAVKLDKLTTAELKTLSNYDKISKTSLRRETDKRADKEDAKKILEYARKSKAVPTEIKQRILDRQKAGKKEEARLFKENKIDEAEFLKKQYTKDGWTKFISSQKTRNTNNTKKLLDHDDIKEFKDWYVTLSGVEKTAIDSYLKTNDKYKNKYLRLNK